MIRKMKNRNNLRDVLSKINPGTYFTAPLTATSLIEVFGDIRDFQAWAQQFLTYFSEAKAFLFSILEVAGFHLVGFQNDMLFIALVLMASHWLAMSDIERERNENSRVAARGDNDRRSFVRPTEKMNYHINQRVHMIFYFFAALLSSSYYQLYQGFYENAFQALVCQAIFAVVISMFLKSIVISYSFAVSARPYCLKEAKSAHNYLRLLRSLKSEDVISSEFYSREQRYTLGIIHKLRYNFETGKKLPSRYLIRLLFIGFVTLALLACFVMISVG